MALCCRCHGRWRGGRVDDGPHSGRHGHTISTQEEVVAVVLFWLWWIGTYLEVGRYRAYL